MDDQELRIASFIRDLREAREYCGVSLTQISEETRISLHYLMALEEGEWPLIPFPYLRGYLISYSEGVGMNLEKVLKRFDELQYLPPHDDTGLHGSDDSAMPEPERAGGGDPDAESLSSPLEPGPSQGEADERLVPTVFEVLPRVHKLALGAGLVLALALLGWGLVSLRLPGWLNPGDSSVGGESSNRREGGEHPVEVLHSDDPTRIELRLERPAALRAFSSDSLYFDGTLRADSTILIRSSGEITLLLERLEDLVLLRDGLRVELPADSGSAELHVSRRTASVIKRNN